MQLYVAQAFSPDTWNILYITWLELYRAIRQPIHKQTIPYLGQYGELRLDVKAAPEPQEGKTVFVYNYSAVLIAG